MNLALDSDDIATQGIVCGQCLFDTCAVHTILNGEPHISEQLLSLILVDVHRRPSITFDLKPLFERSATRA
jgi:hypothetical protein